MGTHVNKTSHGHTGTDKIAYTLTFYIQDFQPDTDPQIVLSFIHLCYCAVYNYANNKFTKGKKLFQFLNGLARSLPEEQKWRLFLNSKLIKSHCFKNFETKQFEFNTLAMAALSLLGT